MPVEACENVTVLSVLAPRSVTFWREWACKLSALEEYPAVKVFKLEAVTSAEIPSKAWLISPADAVIVSEFNYNSDQPCMQFHCHGLFINSYSWKYGINSNPLHISAV